MQFPLGLQLDKDMSDSLLLALLIEVEVGLSFNLNSLNKCRDEFLRGSLSFDFTETFYAHCLPLQR